MSAAARFRGSRHDHPHGKRIRSENAMTEDAQSSVFVWTKMQTESGMSLPAILAIKEIERLAGNGVFWWGIGNSLGSEVRVQAKKSNGTLPVLFSLMLSRPKAKDSDLSGLRIWTKCKRDDSSDPVDLPSHVLEFSGNQNGPDHHYALVCHSQIPLAVTSHGAFDPSRCTTLNGKRPGDSQTTALLKGNPYEDHPEGKYHFGFRATLVEPWAVKLVSPLRLPSSGNQLLLDGWKRDWERFVARIRSE